MCPEICSSLIFCSQSYSRFEMINQTLSVENYFSCIRASLGGCTNPTTVQFTSAYKKLLLGACNKTKYGNCILQDDSRLLVFSNMSTKAVKDISETFDLSDSDQTDIYLSAIEKTSEFSKNALTYISGFVQRKILKRETCLGCHDFLSKSKIKSTCKFIDSVNRGGLIHPNSNLNLIVKVSNSCIDEIKQCITVRFVIEYSCTLQKVMAINMI